MLLVNKMLEREEEFFFKTNGVIFEKALINKSYADYSYYGYCGLSEKFIEIPENKHLIIIVQGVNRQTALHIFDQNTINGLKSSFLSFINRETAKNDGN